MKVPYSFSILRYVHDPVTKEFLNIGVVLYSREAKFLRAVCTTNYGRITRMFVRIEGSRFRQMARYIESRVNNLGDDLPSELPFEPGLAIEALLAKVLPPDDSSFQFSPAGVGITGDLERTLAELFERYVEQYSMLADTSRREDEEIWKVFREPLARRNLAEKLTSKRVVAQNYEYEFQHAWKNGVWHLYEPVSFDLIEASSILEKANRWVGRVISLSDSKDKFHIHILLGEPHDSDLQGAFQKARNILNKMPVEKELVRESEAEDFAEEVAREVAEDRS
jgi:hypothetical protein